MPKLVSEISSGQQFSRSSEEGLVADAQTRVFRIVLNSPGEVVNPSVACGIRIGDANPVNPNIYCTTFDVKFEGESRMVMLCTFQYQSTPGGDVTGSGDPQSQEPTEVPGTLSLSTSLMEMPVALWREVDEQGVVGELKEATNPVGDLYEGITTLSPVLTMSIAQYEEGTGWVAINLDAGTVNKNNVRMFGLDCAPRTLMFRGATGAERSKYWGDNLAQGWDVTYELAYRADTWDILIPQSGFNIFNAPYGSRAGAEANDVEAGSLLLKHDGGKIKGWPNSIEPAADTGAEKTRAMVLVQEYENGGASQLPSAQPIPLNDDGSPRWSKADPKVLVKRYSVYRETVAVFDRVRA